MQARIGRVIWNTQGEARKVRRQPDLGWETGARARERLAALPPFAAAGACRRATVASDI